MRTLWTDCIRLAGERDWIPMTNLMAYHIRDLWKKVLPAGRQADHRQLRIGRDVYVSEALSWSLDIVASGAQCTTIMLAARCSTTNQVGNAVQSM